MPWKSIASPCLKTWWRNESALADITSDFVSEQVIAEETDPAGCKNDYCKDDLQKEVEIFLLEDVKDAPYGDDNT